MRRCGGLGPLRVDRAGCGGARTGAVAPLGGGVPLRGGAERGPQRPFQAVAGGAGAVDGADADAAHHGGECGELRQAYAGADAVALRVGDKGFEEAFLGDWHGGVRVLAGERRGRGVVGVGEGYAEGVESNGQRGEATRGGVRLDVESVHDIVEGRAGPVVAQHVFQQLLAFGRRERNQKWSKRSSKEGSV